jgi:hypothetical protein
VLFISFFLVPYHVGFGTPLPGPDGQTQRDIEMLIDVILVTDIILSFFTDRYSEGG